MSSRAHRLARLTAGATLGLIVAGGLVTSTGAALAVPDWPTTFGHNMLLYPWSRMTGGILIEHSHRLLGAAVGFLTVALAATIWLTDGRGWLRALGAVAVAVVCLQGLLGGLRVILLQDALALVHGCLAPAFFALTVALVVVTSPGWTGPVGPVTPGLARLALLTVTALYGQIVLGALATHEGWIKAHLAGAVIAAGLTVLLVGRTMRRHRAEPGLGGPAHALGLLLVLQLALGFGAYVARFTSLGLPGGEVVVIGLPVAHRAVGAGLLGLAVAVALQTGRGRAARPATAALARDAVAGERVLA